MATRSSRIHSLDAMRGLLAIGIMAYHLLGWTRIASVTTLGTYGVYAFFVLSGFALEWGYGGRFTDPGGPRRYAAARVARILPLYGLAALATAAMTLAARGAVDRSDLLLNLTLTFGLVNPGATSTVVGGWSIGIEVVFYALFPILVLLRLSTRGLMVLAIIALLIRIAWTAVVFQPGSSFGAGLVAYTQVPAFLWFFIAGMVGSRLVADRDRRTQGDPPDPRHAAVRAAWPFAAGLGILGVVVAATLIGDQRAKFVGLLGAALAVAVAAAVVIAGHARPWTGRAAWIATVLGDLSYGTYLLHPIVWRASTHLGLGLRRSAILTFIAAPLLALVVHRLIELPAGRAIRGILGPRVAPRPGVGATVPSDPA